jgi:phosphomannomutase
MAQEHDFRPALGTSREDPDLASHYIKTLLKDFTENYPSTPQRIAWDAGNGATGHLVEQLVKQLPGEHILLNTEIDGRFPNHHPDPTIEKNMRQLQDVVRANSCDYGIGFDGDGDRLGIVDDQGRMLYADQIMMLFAEEVLSHRPGATIIGDVKTSNLFFEKVAALGGVPLMWRTGHAHIKRKLREVQSPLAGEMSGHICFADRYFGFDDALYAALRFVGIRAQSPERLSVWSQSVPVSFSTPEVLISCGSHNKFHLVEEICGFLDADDVAFSAIDGMRVTTPGGWWLLRASNTQDFLVARIEEPTAEALAQTTQIVEGYLRRAGISYAFSEAA